VCVCVCVCVRDTVCSKVSEIVADIKDATVDEKIEGEEKTACFSEEEAEEKQKKKPSKKRKSDEVDKDEDDDDVETHKPKSKKNKEEIAAVPSRTQQRSQRSRTQPLKLDEIQPAAWSLKPLPAAVKVMMHSLTHSLTHSGILTGVIYLVCARA
jgi:hypothetical protein